MRRSEATVSTRKASTSGLAWGVLAAANTGFWLISSSAPVLRSSVVHQLIDSDGTERAAKISQT